jgi:hypothetical protein
MLKKSASGVLASFIGSTYRKYVSPLLSLRLYWTAFLSILLIFSVSSPFKVNSRWHRPLTGHYI